MSSAIFARAAFRSASAAGGRRHFSVISSLRSFARSFEPHPFERLPVTAKAQAGDWGKQVRRVTTQGAIFVPLFGVMLGWPYLAKLAVDDRV
jgi:hypothetical protein